MQRSGQDSVELSPIDAIRNFKATYGRYVDEMITTPSPENTSRLAELFTADIKSNFGRSGPMSSRDELIGFLLNAVAANRSWIWHSFHSPLIEIQGQTAKGYWTIYCLALTKGAEKPDVILGRYEDEYVLTSDGWRQSGLHFRNETPQGV